MGCCGDTVDEDDFFSKRKCTDVFCLVIFLIFISILLIFTSFAFVYGNPLRLTNGYDSFGNVCGTKNEPVVHMNYTGIDMTNRKYVYFFNIWDVSNSFKICVEKCPDREMNTYDELRQFIHDTNSLICYDLAMIEYKQNFFKDSPKWQYVCPFLPIYESIQILNRCIPKKVPFQTISNIHAYLNNIEFLQQLFTDFYTSWTTMLWLSLFSVVLSLLVVLSIHYFALIISWTLVICLSIFSIAFTLTLWWTFATSKNQLDNVPEAERLDKMIRNEAAFLFFSIFATVATIILLLIMFLLRKKIQLVVDLFRAASECIYNIPCLLLQPIWTSVMLFVFTIVWLCVMLAIATASHTSLPSHHSNLVTENSLSNNGPSQLPIAYPSLQFKESWLQSVWWFYIIAFIWICEFILSCQQMVITGAVANWYFKRNDPCPLINSIRKLVQYHFGSIALGSFLITVFIVPRLILTFLDKQLKKNTPTYCRRCIKCCGRCCKCCFWSLEKFIRYMNHNAYTIIAYRGTPFCPSAKRAFEIVSEDVLQVVVLDRIADRILFFGKCAITVITGFVGLLVMKHDPQLYFFAGPIFVVCIFAYFISHCFLSVYEMVIDTLFLCFSEDAYINKEEPQKLYARPSFKRFVSEKQKRHATKNDTPMEGIRDSNKGDSFDNPQDEPLETRV